MNSARILELEAERGEAVEFLQTCARMMQVDIEIGNRENPMGGNFVKDALQRVRELDELIIKGKNAMSDDMKTPLTEEQQILQDEQEAVYLEGQILALRWMRQRAHDYTPSQKNADLLRLWIGRNRGGVLTVDNLEDAFLAMQSHLETVPVVINKVEIQKEVLPPWGKLRNRADIDAISREQYREWLKNPQFVAEVEAVLQRKKQWATENK